MERKRKIDLGQQKSSKRGGELEDSSINNNNAGDEETINYWTGHEYSQRYYDILEKRQKLPVYKFKEELISDVENNQVIIVEGETGSGKTTQIPQFLLRLLAQKGKYSIACTQPRRVAAMSIAKRVSEEMDVELGQEVGYNIRFEDCTSPNTILKFMTDGMLLREAMSDPMLSRYSCIVIDEAHERTLSTDVLMGLLKEILVKRKDLKAIIMSATLDAGRFQSYFNGAPLRKVPGKIFPVELLYLKAPETNYLDGAVRTVLQIHQLEDKGDILVFLTGEEEIENACTQIRLEASTMDQDTVGPLMVYPLYSTLPPSQQQEIFKDAPGPRTPGGPAGRKVVVSTNIAETSLTIDGIVYVVDPGFSKQKVYNPRVRMESLLVSPISQASANQRKGRAGRTRPGKCFRLYTEASFSNDLQQQSYPEILRSKMETVVLTLLKLGIEDLVHFDFMDPPAPETMMRALEQLNYLGALDDEGNMTQFGVQLSEIPVEPQMAKMLLSSAQCNCTDEILSIVSLLSAGASIFMRPKEAAKLADECKNQFAHPDGDHITMLHAYLAYLESGKSREFCYENFLNFRSLQSTDNVRNQLQRQLIKYGLKFNTINDMNSSDYYVNIRKCIASGLFMQVAHLQRQGHYLTCKDQQVVALHPSTVIQTKPQWVCFQDFVLTAKNFIRTVTPVPVEWLIEHAPHYYDLESWPEGETKGELESAYRRFAQTAKYQNEKLEKKHKEKEKK